MERIRVEARAKGYKTVSSYCREIIFNRNNNMESTIIETFKNTEKILVKLK